VRVGAQPLYAYPPPLEVDNAADITMRKQFEASDMSARQHRDGFTGIDGLDDLASEIERHIHFTAPYRFAHERRRASFVADIGKAFHPQQFIRDVLGCDADAIVLHQADRRGFRRPFRGGGRRSAGNSEGASR